MTHTKAANAPAKAGPPRDMDAERAAGRLLRQVKKWLIAGNDPDDVTEAILTEDPTADARGLIVAAAEAIARSAQFDAALVIGFCMEATRDLYRRMVEIGDFTGALRAVKQISDYAVRFADVCDQDQNPHN